MKLKLLEKTPADTETSSYSKTSLFTSKKLWKQANEIRYRLECT